MHIAIWWAWGVNTLRKCYWNFWHLATPQQPLSTHPHAYLIVNHEIRTSHQTNVLLFALFIRKKNESKLHQRAKVNLVHFISRQFTRKKCSTARSVPSSLIHDYLVYAITLENSSQRVALSKFQIENKLKLGTSYTHMLNVECAICGSGAMNWRVHLSLSSSQWWKTHEKFLLLHRKSLVSMIFNSFLSRYTKYVKYIPTSVDRQASSWVAVSRFCLLSSSTSAHSQSRFSDEQRIHWIASNIINFRDDAKDIQSKVIVSLSSFLLYSFIK